MARSSAGNAVDKQELWLDENRDIMSHKPQPTVRLGYWACGQAELEIGLNGKKEIIENKTIIGKAATGCFLRSTIILYIPDYPA